MSITTYAVRQRSGTCQPARYRHDCCGSRRRLAFTRMTTTDNLSESLAAHYRIDREFGAGGMATVYPVHDLRHERKVAIKVLRPTLAALVPAAMS